MNTAVAEMERLKGASAWSPLANVARRRKNQSCARYTFDDGSILTVYLNGDASWFYRDARGFTVGEQRWSHWHRCSR